MENTSWNQKLADWVGNDTEKKAALREQVPRTSLGDYLKAKVINVEKISKPRRAFLYQTTGIQDFYFEGIESFYSDNRQEDIVPAVVSIQSRETTSRINQLLGKVDLLTEKVEDLGATYEPTSEERAQMVAKTVDRLAEHMDYYRNANQQERDELVNKLDVPQWGWVVNVLSGISKKEDIPETFARGFGPPNKKK